MARLKQKDLFDNGSPDFVEIEFTMLDEDRFLQGIYPVCSACGCSPVLRRIGEKYSVHCINPRCAKPYNTATHKFSADAVRCWRLAVQLGKV